MNAAAESRESWTLDLLFVVAWALAAVGVIGLDLPGGAVRAAMAVPLVIFLPGYALVSALFPARNRHGSAADRTGRGLGLLERGLLGVLASAAIVPGVAVVLNAAGVGITTVPLAVTIGGLTVALSGIALLIRAGVPPEHRFRVPIGLDGRLRRYFEISPSASDEHRPFEPTTEGHVVFNVFLCVSVVVLLGSVGFALVSAPADQTFTEMYLLTEGEDGELTAADDPDSFAEVADEPIYVTIENHEGADTEYTVVVQLQTLTYGPGDPTVTEAREIDRFSMAVGGGDTDQREYELPGDEPDDETRLAFLLYKDDPTDEPTADNAYRSVYLDVAE